MLVFNEECKALGSRNIYITCKTDETTNALFLPTISISTQQDLELKSMHKYH